MTKIHSFFFFFFKVSSSSVLDGAMAGAVRTECCLVAGGTTSLRFLAWGAKEAQTPVQPPACTASPPRTQTPPSALQGTGCQRLQRQPLMEGAAGAAPRIPDGRALSARGAQGPVLPNLAALLSCVSPCESVEALLLPLMLLRLCPWRSHRTFTPYSNLAVTDYSCFL